MELHHELQELLHLRKWNSNEQCVLQQIPPELQDSQPVHQIPDSCEYTKTLGVEWNTKHDYFRLAVAQLNSSDAATKRTIISDIARTYDVLGWFSPTMIKVKILLQRLWEEKVDWDDSVPEPIREVWSRWREKLKLLADQNVPRCYYPTDTRPRSLQLHGFSDASESAYAGVVYL